jgi:hypothetical protein
MGNGQWAMGVYISFFEFVYQHRIEKRKGTSLRLLIASYASAPALPVSPCPHARFTRNASPVGLTAAISASSITAATIPIIAPTAAGRAGQP